MTWPLPFVMDPKTLPEGPFPEPLLAEDRWDELELEKFKKACLPRNPTGSTDRLNIEAGLCIVLNGAYVRPPELTVWDRLLMLAKST